MKQEIYTIGSVRGILDNLPYFLSFLDGGKLQLDDENQCEQRAHSASDARIRLANALVDFCCALETLHERQYHFLLLSYLAGFSEFALAQHYRCGESAIQKRKSGLARSILARMNRRVPRCLSCAHIANSNNADGYYCWAMKDWLEGDIENSQPSCSTYKPRESYERRREVSIHIILEKMEVDCRSEANLYDALRMMGERPQKS
jgi:hypothetical protein